MPQDYTIKQPDFAQVTFRGIERGQQMKDDETVRAAQEAALARKQAMQKDLGDMYDNLSPQAITQIMVKYPEVADKFKTPLAALTEQQRTSKIGELSSIYTALESGKPDIAKSLLIKQSDAARNAGDEEIATGARLIADMLDHGDQGVRGARSSLGMLLAGSMGPEKFAETYTKLQQEQRAQGVEGAQLSEAQSKAQKAAVDAKYAESQSAMDLSKKGWDIWKLQQDAGIARDNNRIAAMEAQLKMSGQKLKGDELKLKTDEMKVKLDEAKRARDEKVRGVAADVESARFSMDNMINTGERILKSPNDVVRAATGTLDSRLPTVQEDVAAFEDLVELYGSQAFLAQLPNMKGFGALSNTEGDALKASLQKISTRPGAKTLMNNVQEAQRLLMKMRGGLTTRYGVPDVVPDTPASEPSVEDIDAIMKKYGG